MGATACDSEVKLPELPKPPRTAEDLTRRLRLDNPNEDLINPAGQAYVRLSARIMTGTRNNTIRLINADRFAWTLVDELWLGIHLYTPTVPDGQYRSTEHNVHVRCALPTTIPAGQVVEISLDACVSEPYPVQRGSRVTNFRVIAREGHIDTGIEPSVGIGQ